ncbi:MAG: NYN domain-containing protein [Deltaproteobacteria bacterium]|nr:NYN domain-containing protein [Deltaproteobacteria bacterium]
MANDEPRIAVFVDFENLAIGARDMRGQETFRIDVVLRRLLERGRIVFKRAYCDWTRYRDATKELHQQGVELIDVPHTGMSGKNSADIHMVVDALELCHAKQHIDVFALLTGDSDFSPLVAKLKENDKRVLGVGVKASSSKLLIQSCDEFIYYDDLVRAKPPVVAKPAAKPHAPAAAAPARDAKEAKGDKSDKSDKGEDKRGEAMEWLVETVTALAENYEAPWGSMVKQTLKRVHPGFNESYYGYRDFAELLEDAEDKAVVELDWDDKRGNYQVRLAKAKRARGAK